MSIPFFPPYPSLFSIFINQERIFMYVTQNKNNNYTNDHFQTIHTLV